MFSRQSIQHTQTAAVQAAAVLMCGQAKPTLSWLSPSNISNLFERGYDPEKRVLEEASM